MFVPVGGNVNLEDCAVGKASRYISFTNLPGGHFLGGGLWYRAIFKPVRGSLRSISATSKLRNVSALPVRLGPSRRCHQE